jgi:uncharacterized protein (DUF433 family)
VSERRIRYWDDTGILSPSLLDDDKGGAYGRIYSFRDLVGLRTIGTLRDQFGVSLQTLRDVSERLRRHSSTPWSQLRFFVSGQHLFFKDPETQLFLSALQPGQIALVEALDLEQVALDTQQRANRLVSRRPDQLGQIERNRHVVGNRPVIAGTRIPTAAIWEFHQAGYDEAAILKEYPRLAPIDIQKALEFERNRREVQLAG